MYKNYDRNYFSEKDILQDMLITEKYLSDALNQAVLESNSEQLRQTFKYLQDNAQGHAQMIYETMSEQGLYNIAAQQQTTETNQRYRTTGYRGQQTTATTVSARGKARGSRNYQTNKNQGYF